MTDSSTTSSSVPVSVLLYVHNGEPYLTEALNSILTQSHTQFELCVIDDGSTDGTAELLATAAATDPRVRVQRQEAKGRQRLHETFNSCLAMAQHDLVAIANADDIWRPEKLERQLSAFDEDPDLDVCYHEATFIDATGRLLWGRFRRYDSPYDTAPPRPWQFVSGNPVPNPTVMFKRAIVRRIGLQEVGEMHDHQFWFKATVAGCRFRGLPQRLIRYRLHEGSHSTASSRHEAIRAAHRACATEMIDRYSIEELVPELQLLDSHDSDSIAWAHSLIACALWEEGAFAKAGEYWREAHRWSNDPAVVCGLGLVALRDGVDRDASRLLRLAADAGVGHARAALAGRVDLDTMNPPKWHGKEPPIAAVVEQTDRSGLAIESERRPDPFDIVLVLPEASTSTPDLPNRIARDLLDVSNGLTQRMVGLVTEADGVDALAAGYGMACEIDPALGDSLHLEVDVVPVGQRESVIAAHRLDGAVIQL